MRWIAVSLLGAIFSQAAEPPSTASSPPPTYSGELAAYASLGSLVAQQMRLADLKWTDAQITAFVDGIRAAQAGHGYPADAATQRLTNRIDEQVASLARSSPAPSTESASVATSASPAKAPPSIETFMRTAQAGFGLQKSSSGLLFKIIQPGSGPRPRREDSVILTLKATAADGKTALPQLSGKNVRVSVSSLLPGLVEGVQMLALGGHIVLVLPPSLSFASGEWPAGVERNAPLLFEVTLDDIVSAMDAAK
jgi:FKBP-type peptidyl-prolyl cis-trans isomerase